MAAEFAVPVKTADLSRWAQQLSKEIEYLRVNTTVPRDNLERLLWELATGADTKARTPGADEEEVLVLLIPRGVRLHSVPL